MGNLLWTVIVVLFAFWLLGLLFHIGGALIHLILVVVVITIVVKFLTGRRV